MHIKHISAAQENVGARQMDFGAQWEKGGGLMRGCKVQQILNVELIEFQIKFLKY